MRLLDGLIELSIALGPAVLLAGGGWLWLAAWPPAHRAALRIVARDGTTLALGAAALAVLLLPFFALFDPWAPEPWLAFFYSFPLCLFITVVLNGAVAACSMARLQGRSPGWRDAVKAAWSRLPSLLGTLPHQLVPAADRLLIVPVVLEEGLAPEEALRRSKALTERKYGRQLERLRPIARRRGQKILLRTEGAYLWIFLMSFLLPMFAVMFATLSVPILLTWVTGRFHLGPDLTAHGVLGAMGIWFGVPVLGAASAGVVVSCLNLVYACALYLRAAKGPDDQGEILKYFAKADLDLPFAPLDESWMEE